jgi:hypothetical protein
LTNLTKKISNWKSIRSDLPHFILFSQEKTSPRFTHFSGKIYFKKIKFTYFPGAEKKHLSTATIIEIEKQKENGRERLTPKGLSISPDKYSYKDRIESFRLCLREGRNGTVAGTAL